MHRVVEYEFHTRRRAKRRNMTIRLKYDLIAAAGGSRSVPARVVRLFRFLSYRILSLIIRFAVKRAYTRRRKRPLLIIVTTRRPFPHVLPVTLCRTRDRSDGPAKD